MKTDYRKILFVRETNPKSDCILTNIVKQERYNNDKLCVKSFNEIFPVSYLDNQYYLEIDTDDTQTVER